RVPAALVPGHPLPGRAVALGLVHRPRCGQQVQRVVREPPTALAVPGCGSVVPGRGQGEDVVDLDAGGVPGAVEGELVAGVRVGEAPGEHDASGGAGLDDDVVQVPAQDVVAGVAAVVPTRGVDV